MLVSVQAIERGPLHDFEVHKESWRLIGYTRFLSRFYVEWKQLSYDVKLECLRGDEVNHDSDYYSVDSPTTIENTEVIWHVAEKWRSLRDRQTKIWSIHSGRVNPLPV